VFKTIVLVGEKVLRGTVLRFESRSMDALSPSVDPLAVFWLLVLFKRSALSPLAVF